MRTDCVIAAFESHEACAGIEAPLTFFNACATFIIGPAVTRCVLVLVDVRSGRQSDPGCF